MTQEEALFEARKGMLVARVLVSGALVAIPFAVWHGLAPLGYLATGLVGGLLWLAMLLLEWRRRNRIYGAIPFLILIGGNHLCRALLVHDVDSYFYQWLIVFVLAALSVPAIFHSSVLRFCRLPTV